MRIDTKDTIAGQPAKIIRDFLRYASGIDLWTVEMAAQRLRISSQKARQVVSKLAALKYIERKRDHGKQLYWKTTLKGNSLGLATAGTPIRRETAQRVIDNFLQRCRKVNAEDYYLFKVKRALVFGSFLSDAQQLNDVDLAIELEPKESDIDRHMELCRKRTLTVKHLGRHFSNIVEELSWAQREVTLFLKSRSTAISLHQEDPILKQVKAKVLFEERG